MSDSPQTLPHETADGSAPLPCGLPLRHRPTVRVVRRDGSKMTGHARRCPLACLTGN